MSRTTRTSDLKSSAVLMNIIREFTCTLCPERSCHGLKVCVPPSHIPMLNPNPQGDGVGGGAGWGGWVELGGGGGHWQEGVGRLAGECLERWLQNEISAWSRDQWAPCPFPREDSLRGSSPTVPTPCSWTSGLLSHSNKFLSFINLPCAVFCYNSPNRVRYLRWSHVIDLYTITISPALL